MDATNLKRLAKIAVVEYFNAKKSAKTDGRKITTKNVLVVSETGMKVLMKTSVDGARYYLYEYANELGTLSVFQTVATRKERFLDI